MKAVYFKNKTISMIDKSLPEIEQDEALVKILMSGICNTDIELFEGYYGFEGIPGHEFVGIVERAPQRPDLEGRRVVGEINWGCGACSLCCKGDPRHCLDRKVLGIIGWDGAFAEYIKVPIKNIHALDDAIKNEEAVFTELLAAALEITQQVHISQRQKVAILGDGKLGLLIALALRLYNPGLLLIGKHKEKLAIAEEVGIKTFNINDPEPRKEIFRELGLFDIVIEATGNPNGIETTLDLVKPEGVIVIKSTTHEKSRIDLARVVVNEITLVGSRCGDFPLAISFLKNKWVDVAPLIEAIYPFQDFTKAFDHARKPGAKKALLNFL